MNRPRYRISALVGGFVLLTLLIIMAAFNLLIQRRMLRNADYSLRYAIKPADEDILEKGIYSPETMAVSEENKKISAFPVLMPDGEIADANSVIFTNKEKSVIDWCNAENIEQDKTVKAEIDGNTYYVFRVGAENEMSYSTIISSTFFSENPESSFEVTFDPDIIKITSGQMSANIKEFIAYIDITGEIEMIKQINIVFVISALLTGLFGSVIGFFIGKKLEQNQLAQKQFFENTSHELKTPLTSIRGYAEGLEKGVITDRAKIGKSIAEQTEKMSGLIEEILCFAKLDSGSVKLEKEDIEMCDFLQDCLMPFEGTVLNRELKVSLDLNPMTVSADPDKLDHAVSNLITNSLKYARSRIDISCGNGRFSIQNDCEDLTDDTLEHLFERFYTGRDGNTGIGLAIAKDIIELHGWKITAERKDEGICFTVIC